MLILKTRAYSQRTQYFIALIAVLLVGGICFPFAGLIGYRAVALILLLVVSLNAILFDILPVMLSALLSALFWNFFFIPPIWYLQIATPEDALMFLMYFVIASINAVLTYKIRQVERNERDQIEKEKAIKLYNTLLNSLSHELRTPIATIIGSLDTLRDQQIKLSTTNREALYTEIEIASFRLNRQVENLLSISRLEAGFIQPKYDWIDLNELIFKTVKLSKDDGFTHQILVNTQDDFPLAKLDPGLLEHILYNLIHNALQHTPKQSIITIDQTISSTHCIITISDNGSGFPEHEIDKVFEKFYRIANTSVGGTGLGLSIVKGFTEAMNGKIYLKNRKQGGAQFTLEIPCEFSNSLNLEHE